MVRRMTGHGPIRPHPRSTQRGRSAVVALAPAVPWRPTRAVHHVTSREQLRCYGPHPLGRIVDRWRECPLADSRLPIGMAGLGMLFQAMFANGAADPSPLDARPSSTLVSANLHCLAGFWAPLVTTAAIAGLHYVTRTRYDPKEGAAITAMALGAIGLWTSTLCGAGIVEVGTSLAGEAPFADVCVQVAHSAFMGASLLCGAALGVTTAQQLEPYVRAAIDACATTGAAPPHETANDPISLQTLATRDPTVSDVCDAMDRWFTTTPDGRRLLHFFGADPATFRILDWIGELPVQDWVSSVGVAGRFCARISYHTGEALSTLPGEETLFCEAQLELPPNAAANTIAHELTHALHWTAIVRGIRHDDVPRVMRAYDDSRGAALSATATATLEAYRHAIAALDDPLPETVRRVVATMLTYIEQPSHNAPVEAVATFVEYHLETARARQFDRCLYFPFSACSSVWMFALPHSIPAMLGKDSWGYGNLPLLRRMIRRGLIGSFLHDVE